MGEGGERVPSKRGGYLMRRPWAWAYASRYHGSHKAAVGVPLLRPQGVVCGAEKRGVISRAAQGVVV